MNKTTQITVRGVDPKLKKLIDMGAKRRNTSINQFVLDVVEEAVDFKGGKKASWRNYTNTVAEDGFNKSVLEDFEKIDPKMWQ